MLKVRTTNEQYFGLPCNTALCALFAPPHYYGSVMQFYDALSAGANCIYSDVVNVMRRIRVR